MLLSKLEQMEHSGEETRQGKRTCQRFNYSFQGHQICEASWRFIHDIGELVTVLRFIPIKEQDNIRFKSCFCQGQKRKPDMLISNRINLKVEVFFGREK